MVKDAVQPSESPFGKEWVHYGENPGGKTQGLLELASHKPVGILVPLGITIGASIYSEYYDEVRSRFSRDSRAHFYNIAEPASIFEINRQITRLIPPDRYITVRSSVPGEKSGTGEFISKIISFIGDGQVDHRILSAAERDIYADFSEPDIQMPVDENTEGVGLLIQPVIGDKYGHVFMPALSGVLQIEDGEPLLRIVIGLGTKAVEVDAAITLKGSDISAEAVKAQLGKLQTADGISTHGNYTGIESTEVTDEIREAAMAQVGKIDALVAAWREQKELGRDSYWEFAIDQKAPYAYVVQSNPGLPEKPVMREYEEAEGILLFESEDVVNTGIKRGHGVVLVGDNGFDPKDLEMLKEFNRNERDYLLVVPDKVFWRVTGTPLLELSHFSNAAAVVELQFPPREHIPGALNYTLDHSGGKGGTHFANICHKKDILFLGVPSVNPSSDIRQVIGEPATTMGARISIWNTDFKVSNLPVAGKVEITSEKTEIPFSKRELLDWADEVYKNVKYMGNDEEAEHFYVVLDCLKEAARQSEFSNDTFSALETKDQEALQRYLSGVQYVKDNLRMLESYDDYMRYKPMFGDEMGEYRFSEYLDMLEAQIHVNLTRF